MCEHSRDSWFYFIKSGKVNQFRIKRIVILQRTCRKYHRICRVTICREKGIFSIIGVQNKGRGCNKIYVQHDSAGTGVA